MPTIVAMKVLSSKVRASMSWGPSPEYADWWYVFSWKGIIWAGTVTALTTGALVIFTVLQFWSDDVRDRQAVERERQANLRIALLESDAATARERAAELQVEAERLKAAVAWRTLTPEAAATLKEQLSKQPGAVEIQYVSGNPESIYFAKQLADAFGAANWRVVATGLNLPGRVIWGTHVQGEGTPDRQLIETAFKAAGVWFSGEAIEPAASISDELVPANAPRLIIGVHKPVKALTPNAK